MWFEAFVQFFFFYVIIKIFIIAHQFFGVWTYSNQLSNYLPLWHIDSLDLLNQVGLNKQTKLIHSSVTIFGRNKEHLIFFSTLATSTECS
jgi:hypothetical protein